MGRTLADGMTSGQTERRLVRRNVAWVWPTTTACQPLPHDGHKNQSITTRRQLFASPGGTWKNPKWDLRRERPSGFLSRSNGLEKHTKRQVGSKGTPHVGHADSVMNDEHGSRLDISDWSSPNLVTQVIKVNTTNSLYFFIIISYIHMRIHSIRPCLPDNSGPEPSGARELSITRAAKCITTLHVASQSGSCLIRHEQQ